MKYLTYTNDGCIDLCTNMIKSLLKVGVKIENIYVHCFTENAKKVLSETFSGLNCYKWRDLDSEFHQYQDWSFDPASNFSQIVSWKWKIIKNFYKDHKEFCFVDTDIFFLQNPEADLKSYGKNICIQCDSPGTLYCTGFMYFSGPWSEVERIMNACANNHMDDQLIFNRMVGEIGIADKIQLLDNTKYPNGWVAYKADPPADLSKAIMVHNNHMLGREAKVQKFKENRMWLV